MLLALVQGPDKNAVEDLKALKAPSEFEKANQRIEVLKVVDDWSTCEYPSGLR